MCLIPGGARKEEKKRKGKDKKVSPSPPKRQRKSWKMNM
jgi:hypothetical protein